MISWIQTSESVKTVDLPRFNGTFELYKLVAISEF